MKNEKGSIIVETAIVFPVVILVMVAFSMLVRYFMVYEVMQHGIYETTREVAAYYYLYAATGLEDAHNGIRTEADAAEENLSRLAEPMNKTIDNISGIANGLATASGQMGNMAAAKDPTAFLDEAGDLATTVDSTFQEAEALLQNGKAAGESLKQIAKSPLETLTHVLKLAASDGLDWGVNSAMDLLARALLAKHIPGGDLDRFAEVYGIENLNTAMAWNSGKSGNVEMVLTYNFTLRLFGGYRLQVIQKTTERGWGLGV